MPWSRYLEPCDTLLDAVGHTPLVRLAGIAADGVELLAKVEWYGPTGSVKDRIYRHMIEAAERRHELRPGMTIIECTTGNAGIACAAAAAIKGYRCVIVMPESMSDERKRMIRAYGAELVMTPGGGTDIDLALAKMREIVSTNGHGYYVPGEFHNPGNVRAQMASGEEIWEQTGGQVDAVVASQGTGGWISGVATALKGLDPDVKAYVVEPSECPLLSEGWRGPHGVPGIADGIVPENLDLSLIDGVVAIPTEEALEMAGRLAREHGMLCGPSSGINVVGCLRVAEKHPEFERIVTVIPDTGQRYLSGELFADETATSPVRGRELEAADLARLAKHRDRLEYLG